MWKTAEGSTKQLIQFCLGYFFFYTIYTVAVKWLQEIPAGPQLRGMEFLVYSTAGGCILATGVVLLLRWYRIDSIKKINIHKFSFPSEWLYIIPSGVCTAVVVPTTTLMYSFKGISVMMAMVMMRGAVIIIGRVVDTIQIHQGILKKKVYFEENIAVVVALVAVSLDVHGGNNSGKSLFSSLPVMVIFSSYLAAYAVRIYIMNYFKNTRPVSSNSTHNNKSFFGTEQIASTIALILVTVATILLARRWGITGDRITPTVKAVLHPDPKWAPWAVLAGSMYGIVAFFSVFLFMFKGRTATFASLVNRLTSLIAGTVSTLLVALLFGGKFPILKDWLSFAFILVAVGFMSAAERKRAAELKLAKEIGG